MKIFRKKLNQSVGRAPGEFTYYGEEERKETTIRVIQYNNDEFDERILSQEDQIKDIHENSKVTWIDIEGFSNLEMISSICRTFEVHDLLVEDALNTDHIPKYEEGEEYLIFSLKNFNQEGYSIKDTHVTLLMKDKLVISFQEESSSIIPPKIERIKVGKGRARRKGSDYLFFVLIDSFLDSYYTFFENLREEINKIDNNLLIETHKNHIEDIYDLKNKLTSVRKNLFPLKIAINDLMTDESELIEDDNLKYFNDSKDHINELIEYYNSFSEMINNLVSLNENNMANNTNRVMKVLTIIATIFIPLTFIAGIYGMNFTNMPELQWENGYYFALILMFVVGLGIVALMKWKKWF
jgi:magnesium transporter